MLKLSYIVIKKIVELYKKSPFAFIMLITVLAVTISSFLFFYTTTIKNRSDYISKYETMRTIHVEFNNSYDVYDVDIISIIMNNKIVKPDNIRFFFIDDDYATNPRRLMAYLVPSQYSGDVFGDPITDDSIKLKECVVIPKNEDKAINPEAEEYHVGETMNIAGDPFTVSGVRSSGYLDEIPYTTGLNSMKLIAFDLITPANLSDNEKEIIKSYFQNTLSGCIVTLPKKLTQRVLSSLFIPLFASVFIGIVAVLNFTYIYKYIMEKCRRDYIILRIIGCTRTTGICLAFLQMTLLYTISFIFSIFILIVLNKFGLISYINASINVLDILIIYSSFLILILIIIIPFSFQFVNRTVIDNEKKCQ